MKCHKHTCSWTERFNIVKKSFLPKLISRFNSIAIIIPAKSFVEIHKTFLKFLLKDKGTGTATTIFKKNNKAGGISTLSQDILII